ncbi:MAG TPA: sugar ABC transporter ATP-binding protein [Ktedonobacteraceae bacterium]|nr:sugar ABC transporter ATP-binding protein [Ktedonobacteraceae bacterium]
MTNPPEPIVELSGIAKHFGGVQALRGVDFSLFPGEVHALVGENGAGKSTLVKILAGIYRPDAGVVKVGGEVIELRSPTQAQDLGIAVVQQEPMLFPDLDVAENVFMGRHPRDRFGRVDWKRMYREVDQLLASLDVSLSSHTPVQGLSVAEQQLVEIAKALSVQARVLVLDEPTAALSAHEVEELFTIVKQLRERGVAVLFVSHRLEEVFRIADRLTVLRDGAHIITAQVSEMNTEEIIKHMVGRELSNLFPRGGPAINRGSTLGEVVLEARHLTRTGVFADVSFQLRRGEILGFAGLVGAGRTEVARVLFGIDRAESGEIWLDGKQVHIRSPQHAMDNGIAYVPEDRHQQGLVMNFSIAANVTLAILQQVSRLGLLDPRREQKIAGEYSSQLHIRSESVAQLVNALSGGNQQKVVLSKWLATNPSVLILDEPTRGIDVGAKAEVHRIISDLAARGLAIILISSELPEVLAMADQVIVLHEGHVTGTFARSEATQERVMFAATGQDR